MPRVLIALSATWFALSFQASAQSYEITFDVQVSGVTEAVMRFDDTSNKDVAIDVYDDFVGGGLYCFDEDVTAPMYKCSWGGLTSGVMWFGVSTNDRDQADWLTFNCAYGWINSGDPFTDICETRYY